MEQSVPKVNLSFENDFNKIIGDDVKAVHDFKMRHDQDKRVAEIEEESKQIIEQMKLDLQEEKCD